MKAENYNLNDSLGYLINTISLSMKQKLELELKNKSVTVHQFGILLLIFKKESLTQKEIANQTNGDEPATARLMTRLEEKGCIVRVVDKVDKRKRLVSLTTKGEEMLNELLPFAKGINEDLTSILSLNEKETLFKLLNKIVSSNY